MVLLLQRMVQIYWHCLHRKSKNGAGYELYSKRWLQYAKNGWKKENDLVLKIGFDSSGLYDIGQEKGYGATQNMWMKGVSQSMFEARV